MTATCVIGVLPTDHTWMIALMGRKTLTESESQLGGVALEPL